MKRLLGYALLLGGVNLVCQVLLTLLNREINLTFTAFASLLAIPLIQSTIVVVASPAADAVRPATVAATIVRDRVALAVASAVLLFAFAASPLAMKPLWSAAFVSGMVVLACLTVACHLAAKGLRRAVLPVVAVASAMIAFESWKRFLKTLPARYDEYPTVLVLLATYLPLFIAAIVILLFMERLMRARCRSAGRMVEVAIGFAVAGSLVVAGNYFLQPYVAKAWVPVVRFCTMLVIGSLILAETLFLRHDRGGHDGDG